MAEKIDYAAERKDKPTVYLLIQSEHWDRPMARFIKAIDKELAEGKEKAEAVGVWITSYSVGGAIGPLVGGVLLQHFWWGSVFLIAVPVMVLLLVLAPILLPEFRDPAAGRLDLPSAGLSLVSVLAVIYGLKQVVDSEVEWARRRLSFQLER